MKAHDIMTWGVISVKADETVARAAQIMLENRVSGLPVVDAADKLVGIVTEGDFLRRSELGTQRRRPRWLEFFIGPGRLAAEYVRNSGRKVGEIMTPDPYTVGENIPIDEIVKLMERQRIKRVPVVADRKVVGIVSRANLLHALASLSREAAPQASDDGTIRTKIMTELNSQSWRPEIDITVRNGIVELWGAITDDRQRQAIIVAAENVLGVKRVHDHLVWIEPMSGIFLQSEEDEKKAQAKAS